MEKKNKKPTMRTNCKEALELLERIKKNGGKQKLNKLGEWWAKTRIHSSLGMKRI